MKPLCAAMTHQKIVTSITAAGSTVPKSVKIIAGKVTIHRATRGFGIPRIRLKQIKLKQLVWSMPSKDHVAFSAPLTPTGRGKRTLTRATVVSIIYVLSKCMTQIVRHRDDSDKHHNDWPVCFENGPDLVPPRAADD